MSVSSSSLRLVKIEDLVDLRKEGSKRLERGRLEFLDEVDALSGADDCDAERKLTLKLSSVFSTSSSHSLSEPSDDGHLCTGDIVR